MYTLLTWVSVQLDFAPMDRQSMETDVDCQTGGSEMSSASQNPESDDEDHKGAIYAAHVIDAIHLYLCILCHFSMAHPRLNEVCPCIQYAVNTGRTELLFATVANLLSFPPIAILGGCLLCSLRINTSRNVPADEIRCHHRL